MPPRPFEQATVTSTDGLTSWPDGFRAFYTDRYQPLVRLSALILRRRDVAEEVVHMPWSEGSDETADDSAGHATVVPLTDAMIEKDPWSGAPGALPSHLPGLASPADRAPGLLTPPQATGTRSTANRGRPDS